MFLPDDAVSSLLSLLDAFHGVWGKHKAFLDGTVSRVLMYHLHKQGLSGWVPKLLISPTLFSWPYNFTTLVPLCEDCAAQHWLLVSQRRGLSSVPGPTAEHMRTEHAWVCCDCLALNQLCSQWAFQMPGGDFYCRNTSLYSLTWGP